MAKVKNETTSPKMASKAGKILGSKKSTKREKSLAGALLTQAPDKKSKPRKK